MVIPTTLRRERGADGTIEMKLCPSRGILVFGVLCAVFLISLGWKNMGGEETCWKV